MIPDSRTAPAALPVDTVRAWRLEPTDGERRMGPRFARWDARRWAGAFLRGWRSPLERTHGWPWAAVHGDGTPSGIPPLLGRAVWAAEAGRAAVRGSVLAPLGAPPGVVAMDAPGCLKKGRHAAGGARP